jgi:hypothetical protein
MTSVGFVLVIAAAVLIGIASQLVGRARETYEWEIGTVGALYGGLLANGLFASRMTPGFGIDGLLVVPTLLGGALIAGLLVFGIRKFGSPISSSNRLQPPSEVTVCARRVKLEYAAALIEEPIVDRMRRQFGVAVRVERAEIIGDRGSIELQLIGAPNAVDSAVLLAQRSGIAVLAEAVEALPAAAA